MKHWEFLFLGMISFLFIPFFAYGLACTSDSDCPSGYVCRNNICSIESGLSVTVTVPGPSAGGGVPSFPATVIFEGRAYPGAFLTLLKDDRIVATFFAENSGLFKKELTGVSGGTYNFGIFAEDTEGRKSVTLSFTIGILGGTITTISRIFIPPTISLFPVEVERGDEINISGQVFPKSRVDIFISPGEIIKEIIATEEGRWSYKLNTTPLTEKEYRIRAKAFFGEGEQSQFSQTISFLVSPSKCRGADLNFDGKVNIVDFSILLYFWGQKKPANRCADINFDGIVNIVDFSIMMYWWTG
jgi:Cys-rich repeat protein